MVGAARRYRFAFAKYACSRGRFTRGTKEEGAADDSIANTFAKGARVKPVLSFEGRTLLPEVLRTSRPPRLARKPGIDGSLLLASAEPLGIAFPKRTSLAMFRRWTGLSVGSRGSLRGRLTGWLRAATRMAKEEDRVRQTRGHAQTRRRFDLDEPRRFDRSRNRLVTSSAEGVAARSRIRLACSADGAGSDARWTSSDDASAGSTDDACSNG